MQHDFPVVEDAHLAAHSPTGGNLDLAAYLLPIRKFPFNGNKQRKYKESPGNLMPLHIKFHRWFDSEQAAVLPCQRDLEKLILDCERRLAEAINSGERQWGLDVAYQGWRNFKLITFFNPAPTTDTRDTASNLEIERWDRSTDRATPTTWARPASPTWPR